MIFSIARLGGPTQDLWFGPLYFSALQGGCLTVTMGSNYTMIFVHCTCVYKFLAQVRIRINHSLIILLLQ